MGQLKDITLTEEQRNKMYNDWQYLRDSGDDITTNLPASYRQQFIDWIRVKDQHQLRDLSLIKCLMKRLWNP